MTDLRKAAEVAATDLEELIIWHGIRDSNDKLMPAHNQTPEIKSAVETLEALRQALAQPEQEPVARMNDYNACKCPDNESRCFSDRVFRMMQKYTAPTTQPEQRPVGTYEG